MSAATHHTTPAQPPKLLLESAVRAALTTAFGPEIASETDPMLTSATKPEFGDYQANVALPLAKRLKAKPRDVASQIADLMAQNDAVRAICDTPFEIAGPGFINIRLSKHFITRKMLDVLNDTTRLGLPKSPNTLRVVVDFSSPNIAKEMHVGHLRSTIIGDALCRILSFLGHDVVRLNHVGDWGTQFGMLIEYMSEVAPSALHDEDNKIQLGDLVEFYKKAKKRFDEDEAFQVRARNEVVKLQSGNEDSLAKWKILCEQSRKEFDKIYDTLDVRIEERGESFYNPYLPAVVEDLKNQGLAVLDQGAVCVFLDGYKNKDGNAQPLIVQKSDGGFMYSTTDLAAIKYRVEHDKAQRILYLTDEGQATHFAQVFQVARRAKFLADTVSLEHVPFGLVQGEDGKKFKTRAGDTVRLKDLLDEAVEIARKDLIERLNEEGRTESEDYIDKVSRVIGISAVKYADLKNNRTTSYRFSYSKMLSLQGNTAPYMLYAYARIQGIYRKGGIDITTAADSLPLALDHPSELELAKHILKLPEVLQDIERELKPNYLCEFLFELSSRFNQFYENCSVLNAETEQIKLSRLALCEITASTIKFSMNLLGIEVLPRL